MLSASRLLLVFALWLLSSGPALHAQQVPDTNFKPKIAKPAYAEGRGPTVLIDEAHFNFHTAGGRYQTFADLLRRDGYVVQASTTKFTKETLQAGRILVIANPVGERNQSDWSPPYDPAFTDAEVAAVREWVQQGGALWLIVDHLPIPAAADKLAQAFGVRFHNGYALEPETRGRPMIFQRADDSLRDHPITRGRGENEKVTSVATFTGSAFQAGKDAAPLFVLGARVASFVPPAAGQFTNDTPSVPVGGWLQGAALRSGKGRVAVFGEAAMFSAQLAGPNRAPMGMNDPLAAQNPQLLLNVAHWLAGLLDKQK